jgi:hypothetical protein
MVLRAGAVVVGLALALPIGCGAGGEHDGSGGGGRGGSGSGRGGSSGGELSLPGYSPPSCVAGSACTCDLGRAGTAVCPPPPQLPTCKCNACPPQVVEPAPTVEGCGGNPIGLWRLTKLDWGSRTIALQSNGLVTNCDAMVKPLDTELPRMFMDLAEGGKAVQFAEPIGMSFAFANSCLTKLGSGLSCDTGLWSPSFERTVCNWDCETCVCGSGIDGTHTSIAGWRRTEEAFTIGILEYARDYAYCVTDTQLELSADGVHLVFERVRKLSEQPQACALRTPDTCLLGRPDACSQGACVGESKCLGASTEGVCLTFSGCSWDPDACVGVAPTVCDLSDFGLVPGCELTN